jgi:recombinational DNA repair ATPase RecF
VKIENITIQGFRGFNKEKSITMHPALTLFYGPNSYGKTSITEAVEWLIYGRTSKVATGESKEEYKGSYRNCHIAEEYSTFVKVRFLNNGIPTEFEAELAGEDGMEKCVDGKMTE